MFYVYTLADPRDGSVFYVGKGKDNRIFAHEREAERGVHSAKCDTIRGIWAAGLSVVREKVSHHDDENEALQAEFDLIASIGLENLTNVVPGGVMGYEAYMRRLSEAKARSELKHRERMAKSLGDMAPKYADLIRHVSVGNGYGFYIRGKWFEAGDCLMESFHMIVKAVGFDRSREIMLRHGVELNLAA